MLVWGWGSLCEANLQSNQVCFQLYQLCQRSLAYRKYLAASWNKKNSNTFGSERVIQIPQQAACFWCFFPKDRGFHSGFSYQQIHGTLLIYYTVDGWNPLFYTPEDEWKLTAEHSIAGLEDDVPLQMSYFLDSMWITPGVFWPSPKMDHFHIVNRSFVQLLKSNFQAMLRPLVSISKRKDRVF